MPTPNTTTPITITPNAIRYPLVQFYSSVKSNGDLLVSAIIQLQRAQKENEKWIDDPSPNSTITKHINDINVYAAENPEIGALIAATWENLDAVISAINIEEQLV